MYKSKYTYFFELDNEFVGYSWLTNKYASFKTEDRPIVERLLEYPDDVMTNKDVAIYDELSDKMFVIPDSFDEYNRLIRLHRKNIYAEDKLFLTIMPTMACNCRCTYCYEAHPLLRDSTMSTEVIANLKKYIQSKIRSLKCLSIGWFGGEPLMRMDIIQDVSKYCYDLCEKNGVVFLNSMSSNGVPLTKVNAERLSSVKLHNIQITLDGPEDNHNKTRITINRKGTFNFIYKNILNYLDIHEHNKITLRVHFPTHADEQYLEGTLLTLNRFDRQYRKSIYVYPHVLYSACSDILTAPQSDNMKEHKQSNVELFEILKYFREKVYQKGFIVSPDLNQLSYCYCLADVGWYWVVRPDGYLSKCTVMVEREQAQARLTPNGIEINNNRFFQLRKKEFSGTLINSCRNCKYLPLCWHGCALSLKANHTINDFIQSYCHNIEKNWLMNRKLDDIKYRYLKTK